jgi:MGT family glycosyltransferase
VTKYGFLTFPTYGQMNPTLAIAQELVSRGDEVVYFQTEAFRRAIQATGARLLPGAAPVPRRESSVPASADEDNRRLAALPIRMVLGSRSMVPPLLESVSAESPDCLVYGHLFLWGRIVAHALDIPGVALCPTYAPGAVRRPPAHPEVHSSAAEGLRSLPDELAHLAANYHLPFSDLPSLVRGAEKLVIVCILRSFQPLADTFDDRFHFVGPAFRADRDKLLPFPRERLEERPLLYISLGTLYNNRADFYNACLQSFAGTEWKVTLSLGERLDRGVLQTIPENFTVVAQAPQLEVLARADVFLTHGGMNSTMESLYCGVPLIVLPHTREQEVTARRVVDLGLGIQLDEDTTTAEQLRHAVERVSREPSYTERIQAMQKELRAAGGYRRAADLLQAFK